MTTKAQAADAYPLCWPAGWPRKRNDQRRRSPFKPRSLPQVRYAVLTELQRWGAAEIIVSTNHRLTRGGAFDDSAGATKYAAEDPGAAVYFKHRGRDRVIACDNYGTLSGNLRAISATIEALRAVERHGSADLLDRAFQGFAALPGAATVRPWNEVLDCGQGTGTDSVERLIRARLMGTHPDRGGSAEAFAEVQRAADEFRRERGLS